MRRRFPVHVLLSDEFLSKRPFPHRGSGEGSTASMGTVNNVELMNSRIKNPCDNSV